MDLVLLPLYAPSSQGINERSLLELSRFYVVGRSVEDKKEENLEL